MKISTRIIIILLLLFPTINFSQEAIKVSGQLKDKETKENVIFAGVMIANQSDSIVTRGVTDSKGYFKLPVSPGSYKVIFSVFGYQNDTIETGLVYQDKFLGVFKIEKSNEELKEVSIEGSAQRNDFDKDVHVITDQQKKGASDTKDVLDRINGVTYDRYQGTISVDNDKNILILVNGVEKDQEYVKNLAPDRLLRVEIVRDPGGRYGLEGYTAIVNVILRNDYKGTEIFFQEQPIFDLDTKNMSDILLINDAYLSYNYTYNKLNVYGTARSGRNNFPISISSESVYNDTMAISEFPADDSPNSLIQSYNQDYTLGFDYTFKPGQVISFESSLKALPKASENNSFSNNAEISIADTLVNKYNYVTTTNSRTINSYNSLFYVGKFKNDNELNINLTYNNYKQDYTTVSYQSSFYDRNENGINKKQSTRFNAEFTHPFSNQFIAQIGYGNTWRNLNNDFNVAQTNLQDTTITSSQNNFQLTDFRNKVYAYFSWKQSQKFGIKFGMAGEFSAPESDGVKLNYFVYQPLLDITYVASKNFNAKFKYRADSDYPSISNVNPFVSQVNPFAVSKGDPLLKPTIIHRLSLRANILQGLASVEPYYFFSNNYITQTGQVREDGLFEFNSANVNKYEKKGFKFNFVIPFSKKIILQNGLNMFNNTIEHEGLTTNFGDWSASSKLIFIMDSINTVGGLIYQKENIKHINGLGYQKGNIDYWMIFIQKQIFKKKGSIMLGYFLPLDFAVSYDQGSIQSAPGYQMQNIIYINLVKNMFLIEFSYRFSKGKTVRKTEKEIEKESEGGGGGLF
jgi:hypothetical protein